MSGPARVVPSAATSGRLRSGEVLVWDPLVRIFHWSLVASFAIAFLSGDDFERIHIWAGYVVLGLVAFRVLWGFIGPRHARFSDFVCAPRQVLAYVLDLVRFRAKRTLGHNPAGGAMIVALLLMLLATGGSGYLLTLPDYTRAKWLKELHEVLANATLGLVVLHVAGVLFSSLVHQENLVRAMITGRKRAE